MPFNKINITLTATQMNNIQTAINTILTELPVKFNLTKAERTELPNINNTRYPYIQRSVLTHAPTNPTLVSGFAGTLTEATNDLTFFDQMEKFIPQLLKVVEVFQDTQQVAGAEAYAWLREFYRSSQSAAANNLPGSDSVVDDLKTLFEAQGGGSAETPPAV